MIHPSKKINIPIKIAVAVPTMIHPSKLSKFSVVNGISFLFLNFGFNVPLLCKL